MEFWSLNMENLKMGELFLKEQYLANQKEWIFGLFTWIWR